MAFASISALADSARATATSPRFSLAAAARSSLAASAFAALAASWLACRRSSSFFKLARCRAMRFFSEAIFCFSALSCFFSECRRSFFSRISTRSACSLLRSACSFLAFLFAASAAFSASARTLPAAARSLSAAFRALSNLAIDSFALLSLLLAAACRLSLRAIAFAASRSSASTLSCSRRNSSR